MTRGRLIRETDAREINEWAAYQRIRGPIGPERGDLHAGIIASAAVAPHCKKGQSVAPIDFMPFCKSKSKQRMSNKQLAGVFAAARAGFTKK